MRILSAAALLLLASCGLQTQVPDADDTVLLTVIGSNDVHGELLPSDGGGGLTTLSGYVEVVRRVREADGGALRARIREARFPLLSANIVDTAAGRLIDRENVRPSILIDVAGVRVGIVGVLTRYALQVTNAANTKGLEIAPSATSTRSCPSTIGSSSWTCPAPICAAS